MANLTDPPYRLTWNVGKFYRLQEASIGEVVEQIWGTYPPFFVGTDFNQDSPRLEAEIRKVARGYEGWFFAYDIKEAVKGRERFSIPVQFAAPRDPGPGYEDFRYIEPVGFPFAVSLQHQGDVSSSRIKEAVLAEASKRGLEGQVTRYKKGDPLLGAEGIAIFPVQLYKNRQ